MNYYFWIKEKYFRINFSFADSLLSNPNIKLQDTFKRRSYGNIKIRVNPNINCQTNNCEAKKILKWIRNGKACMNNNCSLKFSELFETYEQKQVDTHLCSDAIYAITCGDFKHIALLSSDLDFSPVFFTAANQSKTKATLIKRTDRPNYWENNIKSSYVTIINY